MTHQGEPALGGTGRHGAFNVVKYIVYFLLACNIFLFLQEELLALEHTFVGGYSAGQVIQVFSSTIDTAAWVVLLALFELETSVLDDRYIKGWVKRGLHGIRGVCYCVIAYAFTGYYAELVMLYQSSALAVGDACSILGSGYSLLLDLDDYAVLDGVSCVGVGADLYQLTGFDIIADGETLQAARWLAWTDVINSADWILVCLLLEVEVRLQLRGKLSDQIMGVSKYLKLVVYGILFVAAAYWGYAGDFLDFWDAALWLFAFIFIELNVFDWQNETSATAAETV